MIYPRKEFEKASCKDANIEKSLIVDMFEKIEAEKWNLHSILLVKDGAKVFETYAKGSGPEIPEEVYSISKSFTCIAAGICQDKKLFKLTDLVLPFFAKDLKSPVAAAYDHLKIEHLLTMTVGQSEDGIHEAKNGKDPIDIFFHLPLVNEPGTTFFYNNLATYILSCIIHRVTGKKVNDFLDGVLYPVLDIEKPVWKELNGETCGFGGLQMGAVGLAKFGLLLINEGDWRGHRVVSREFVNNATRYHVSTALQDNPRDRFGYGYLFWMNDFGDYRAAGMYKSYIVLNKEFNTVIVVQSYEEREVLDLVSGYMLPALFKGWQGDNFTLRTYLQRFTDHSGPIIDAEKLKRLY
jgi:CubicO group peptidase (beta-lactamase class C family)